MKLSNNFYLSEVIKSSTADRHGIDNSLPEELIDNARAVAENILQPVRDHFKTPYSPNSWFRCEELNSLIRGSKTSDHLKASAVDIEIARITNLELAKFIKDNLEFDQLILEFYKDGQPNSGWVHCSYKAGANRRQIMRYDGKTYKLGLED